MGLVYPSSTPTLEPQPKPSTNTLGISIPHHSVGFVGVGVLRLGVRWARNRRCGGTSRGCARSTLKLRF